MKNQLIIILLSIPFIFFISCDKDDKDRLTNPIDLIAEEYDNIPVKVNTQNSYTFTINAMNFTYSTEDNLVFTNDSILVTITLTNASSNNSSFILYDNMGGQIFSESLNESKVLVDTDLIGKQPSKCTIDLIDFTGQLTIVVAQMNE